MSGTVSRRVIPEGFGAANSFEMYFGVQVPDPITFIIGDRWLGAPNIYPRQATIIKVIFARLDLLTDYDNQVIDEWEDRFRKTGDEGIVPGVRDRMRYLNLHHAPWFREVMLAMGRRASKGYLASRAQAYVLWNYLATGNPQQHFGVDRGKALACLVFAGKRDQAKATVFGDLVNVVVNSGCFAPYISTPASEKLTIYAPNDFVRMQRMADKGIVTKRDMATFEVMPKESTTMAGRGPTSFSLCFDEMAHLTASGTSRSADDVYGAAKPSTDQFKDYAFIIEPSSPWQKMGKFYENCVEAVALDERGVPERPNYLLVQLPSWDLYKDWDIAGQIPIFPPGFTGDLGEYRDGPPLYFPAQRSAVQDYDAEMVREKKSNPELFAVEREAKWANVLDNYLREGMVDAIFEPWSQRPDRYGPPELQMDPGGVLSMTYVAHGDPAKINDSFGYCVGHIEVASDGLQHAVIDLVGSFHAQDFPGGIIDYDTVEEWFWQKVILRYHPDQLTFDQFNSVSTIQRLQKRIRSQPMPKRTEVFEQTVTRPMDWIEKERTKAAIYNGLVHSPFEEQLRDELKFLQLVNGRVDHPTSGPVQGKDEADSLCSVVNALIGESTQAMIRGDLAAFLPQGQGQPSPFARQMGGEQGPGALTPNAEDRQVMGALGGFSRSGMGSRTPHPSHRGGGTRVVRRRL